MQALIACIMPFVSQWSSFLFDQVCSVMCMVTRVCSYRYQKKCVCGFDSSWTSISYLIVSNQSTRPLISADLPS